MSWIAGDFTSRETLYNNIYSAIGNTEESLNGLPKEISNLVVDYLEAFTSFGEREWKKLGISVDPAPPLPRNFSDGPCPIYEGKTLSETHILVYIPAKVDGKPFTLQKLGEIAKRFFPKNLNGYKFTLSGVNGKLGHTSIESGWRLMTNDVLPGSRNKSYAYQQEMVAKLAKESLGYEIPGALEAATGILTRYFFDSQTRLFPYVPLTYTRCKEELDDYQTMVGGFDTSGLDLIKCLKNNTAHFVGIAVLRKL